MKGEEDEAEVLRLIVGWYSGKKWAKNIACNNMLKKIKNSKCKILCNQAQY